MDKRLLQLLTSKTKKWVGVSVLLGWLIVLLNMAQIVLIGSAVDQLFNETPPPKWFFYAFMGIILVRALITWATRQTAHKAAEETKLSLRERLYEHITKLGPGFAGGERTGALVNTAVEGIENLEVYFGLYIPQLILGLSIPILIVIFILQFDWLTALALLLSQPLIPISLGVIQRQFREVSKKFWASANLLSAQFLDSLQGLPTLKMFNHSKTQGEKIHEQTERLRKDTMRVLAVNQVSLFFIDWTSTLGTTVVAVGMAAWRLQLGMLSFGEALILVLLSVELARPLALLGSFFHAGASGIAAAQRIFDILEIEPQVKEAEQPKRPASFTPSIEFENVSFAYEAVDAEKRAEKRTAINDLSFAIQSGETVALVGASGAGKSTVVNLLHRFYDPQKGEIRLGGTPLKALSLNWLREQISLVAQDTYLFYGTIAQNLQFAQPNATQAQIESATQHSHIHEFIQSLPDGYQTQIGERGLSLSGGQAQRLAIARALLKDAPIIVLDEATSHVDAENESHIQEAIEALTAEKTVLIIAHRLSTVRNADRILVMDAGNVVEVGTHDALLKKDGVYARLVSTQNIGSVQ